MKGWAWTCRGGDGISYCWGESWGRESRMPTGINNLGIFLGPSKCLLSSDFIQNKAAHFFWFPDTIPSYLVLSSKTHCGTEPTQSCTFIPICPTVKQSCGFLKETLRVKGSLWGFSVVLSNPFFLFLICILESGRQHMCPECLQFSLALDNNEIALTIKAYLLLVWCSHWQIRTSASQVKLPPVIFRNPQDVSPVCL